MLTPSILPAYNTLGCIKTFLSRGFASSCKVSFSAFRTFKMWTLLRFMIISINYSFKITLPASLFSLLRFSTTPLIYINVHIEVIIILKLCHILSYLLDYCSVVCIHRKVRLLLRLTLYFRFPFILLVFIITTFWTRVLTV